MRMNHEAAVAITPAHQPPAVFGPAHIAYLVVQPDVCASGDDQLRQTPGQRTEVDIGAVGVPGGGDGRTGLPAAHHQRCPLLDDGRILGEFHCGECRFGHQSFVAAPQVGDIAVPEHHVHMRHGMDERPRIQQTVLREV